MKKAIEVATVGHASWFAGASAYTLEKRSRSRPPCLALGIAPLFVEFKPGQKGRLS